MIRQYADFSDMKSRYLLLDIVIILFLITVILAIPFMIFGIDPASLNTERNPVLAYGVSSLFMILLCLKLSLRMRKRRIHLKPMIGKLWNREVPWLMLLIVFYCELGVKAGVRRITLFVGHLVSPDQINSWADIDISIPYDASIILLIISIVIVAPLTEEFIFRGIFLHRWSKKWGVTTGIIVSSVVFGVGHFDFYILDRVIGGFVLAVLYCQTQMLSIPILIHMAHNFLALGGQIVNDLSAGDRELQINATYLWHGVVELALALPALFYFLRLPKNLADLPYSRNQAGQPYLKSQDQHRIA